jgi:hypothetical protein
MGDKGPLPVDPLPCTAVLSKISYAPRPFVKALSFDGSEEEWTIERYAREAQIWGEAGDPDQPNPVMLNVKSFEIGLPVRLLRDGMTVIDSPGISEDPRRTALTRDALADVHAGIIMFRSDAMAGMDELQFAQEVLERTGHAFAVVNMINEQRLDERFRRAAASRMAVLEKSEVAGRLAPEVHYIQCKQAFTGYRNALQDLIRESRIQEFERQLAQFLLQGAYHARIVAVVSAIDKLAGLVAKQLVDLKNVLQTAQAVVRLTLQQCRQDMQEIDARQEKIAHILRRIRRRATEAGTASYLRMITQLEDNIEDRFAARPLQTMQNWRGKIGSLIGHKAAREAVETLNDIIKRHIQAWSESEPPARGLQNDLMGVIDEGREELRVEYKGIDDKLRTMQLRLTALDAMGGTAEGPISLQDRLIGTGLGIVLLGPIGVTAALGGWRATLGGVLGALTAKLGVALLAGMLGIAIAPAVLAGAIVAAVFGGSLLGGLFDLETRVRRKALEAVSPALRKLRQDQSILDELVRQIDEGLRRDGEAVLEALNRVLSIEKEKLQALERSNSSEISSREAKLADLDRDMNATRDARSALARLASEAGQTMATA